MAGDALRGFRRVLKSLLLGLSPRPFLPHLTLSASALACVLGLACGQRGGNEPESAGVLPPENSFTSFTDNLGAFANGSISLVSEANILAGHVYCLDSDSF